MPVPKETTKPGTVVVKLRDGGSCFFDQANQICITGRGAVEVKQTTKVAAGIRGGALVKAEETELKKPVQEPTETDEAKAERLKQEADKAKAELLAKLREDKADFNQTDYKVLQGWVSILGLTPASKKQEDLIAALEEAVKVEE